VPMVLVGNKCNLKDFCIVAISEGADLARSFGCKFLKLSAKSCINVEECFFELVQEICKSLGTDIEKKPLQKNNKDGKKGSKCSLFKESLSSSLSCKTNSSNPNFPIVKIKNN